MRSRNSSTMGALHPVLFFAGVYVVVLLFSIFICSTIFYSCNASKTDVVKKEQQKAPATGYTTASITLVK
ncbi:MAG TPA: hypothetical protein VFD24_10995 [Chitinophagaceae bacterium]|jgi:hypothetical protein|nr:hypothetical protein [Chitinophagaceae bacterium]